MKKLDFKDWINPGQKCYYQGEWYGMWYDRPHTVVIGEYKPYYTDGTPDPTPDEYDRDMMIECKYLYNTRSSFYKPNWVWENDQFLVADLRPVRHISECDEDDLRKIFKEVTFGSLDYSDYLNSLDVDEHEVCDFCEGYSDMVAGQHEDWWSYLSEDDFVEYCMEAQCVA